MRLLCWLTCAAITVGMFANATARSRQRTAIRPLEQKRLVRKNPVKSNAWRFTKRRKARRRARTRSRLAWIASGLRNSRSKKMTLRKKRTLTSRSGVRFRVRLKRHQASLLQGVRRIAPGLLPPLEKVAAGQYVIKASGKRLVSSSDLYIAPYAMEKLSRLVFLLNSSGIQHGAIRPENIVVDESGQLLLAGGWQFCKRSNKLADSRGLALVRSYLRRELGMGG